MMKEKLPLEALLDKIVVDPELSEKYEYGYDLLQLYFNGDSVETLRPLLRSPNVTVRRIASSVLSELGIAGKPLIDEAVSLLSDSDISIQYNALENIIVCAIDDQVDKIKYVVDAVEYPSQVIRVLAMFLFSNADDLQISAAKNSFSESETPAARIAGLTALSDCEILRHDTISEMIESDDLIMRKFGAIIAKKLVTKFPDLIELAGASSDLDLIKFTEEVR